ncbi:hypothetical protein C0J52_02506, partial [Blattella germanica]
LRGKNPREVHCVLSEVCGELAVGHSTDSHWFHQFQGGHRNTDDDPNHGRPRTSTDKRSVKLVADALEKDCRVTCVELSEATGIYSTSAYHNLSHDLKKRKISVLTAELKNCVNMDGSVATSSLQSGQESTRL